MVDHWSLFAYHACVARSRTTTSETSTGDAAFRKLHSYLDRKAFAPGAQLPAERALAAQLRLSRPALREAIKAFVILDVLESRRGAGTFVKGAARDLPANATLTPESFDHLDLLEVRRMYEPRAAWLAAARASESQLRDIERSRRLLEKHELDDEAVAANDWDFHSAIVRAAGNPVLDYVNRLLTPLMMSSRRVTARSRKDRRGMHSDHRAIVTAIARGDSPAAEQAMLAHLQRVGVDLITEIDPTEKP